MPAGPGFTSCRAGVRAGFARLRGALSAEPIQMNNVTESDQVTSIERYVLGLEEIGETQVALAGGKGAHLGELSRSRVFACLPRFA